MWLGGMGIKGISGDGEALEVGVGKQQVFRRGWSCHRLVEARWVWGRDWQAPQVMDGVRFGAFLRHIPAARRVGDFAHAAARVVNAVFRRVFVDAKGWDRSAAKALQTSPSPTVSGGGDGQREKEVGR